MQTIIGENNTQMRKRSVRTYCASASCAMSPRGNVINDRVRIEEENIDCRIKYIVFILRRSGGYKYICLFLNEVAILPNISYFETVIV